MWCLVRVQTPTKIRRAEVLEVIAPFNTAEEAIRSLLGDAPIVKEVLSSNIRNHFSINDHLFAAIEIEHHCPPSNRSESEQPETIVIQHCARCKAQDLTQRAIESCTLLDCPLRNHI